MKWIIDDLKYYFRRGGATILEFFVKRLDTPFPVWFIIVGIIVFLLMWTE